MVIELFVWVEILMQESYKDMAWGQYNKRSNFGKLILRILRITVNIR